MGVSIAYAEWFWNVTTSLRVLLLAIPVTAAMVYHMERPMHQIGWTIVIVCPFAVIVVAECRRRVVVPSWVFLSALLCGQLMALAKNVRTAFREGESELRKQLAFTEMSTLLPLAYLAVGVLVCLYTTGQESHARCRSLALPLLLSLVRRTIEVYLTDGVSLARLLLSIARPQLLYAFGILSALGVEHYAQDVWKARLRCEHVERENEELKQKLSQDTSSVTSQMTHLRNQLHATKGFADEVAAAVASNSLALPEHLTRLLEASGSWPPPYSAARASPSGLRLLLVDDQRINLLVLERCLRRLLVEPTVHKASESSSALEWLLQTPRAVDVAFIDEDLGLASEKGTAITRCVRDFETAHGLPRMPIIGVTAHAGIHNHDAMALAAGQDLVVGKPLPTDLRSVLLDLIEGSQNPGAGNARDV